MNRIAERRKELRLTQLELARRVGVTENTVYRWEHEGMTPRGRALRKLAKALDCDVADLGITARPQQQ